VGALVNLPASEIKSFPDLGRVLTRFLALSPSMREHGIRPIDYHAMLLLKIAEGSAANPSQLARRMKIRRDVAVKLAETLVSAGLAEAPEVGLDAGTQLRLSARGEALLGQIAARHLDELRKIERLLSQALPHLDAATGAPDTPDA
jgi:DNA-binding MarR family transcriptional regulator